MAESEQKAAVRRFVEAFNRRDFDVLVADTNADLVIHEWPAAPGAQSYHGPDGLRKALDSWFESWEWMEVELHDMEEAGDRVMAVFHQRAQGKGSAVEVEIDSFNVWLFEDGIIKEISLFTEREPALEAFRR
jgi:ketosteroid isomerase-like protein